MLTQEIADPLAERVGNFSSEHVIV